MTLFDPEAHEPLTETAWDAELARSAIRAIAAETERAFDPDELWPPHPLDEEDDSPLRRAASLYLGAAGVVWALDALRRSEAVELERDWRHVALGLPDRYRAEPDFPDYGVVPSLWLGETGILLVAHTLAPAAWQEEQLLAAIEANADNPTRELMWGSPGTMLAAQVLHVRTGAATWRAAWEGSADRLWDAWRGDLWEQDLYGHRQHIFGPAHGFAGNVYILARGDLLDAARREELERRAVATLAAHALRADGLAQWPPAVEPSRVPRRTQWCHGAPGIVASLASLAPGDDELTELLVAGGELTWRAGPLREGREPLSRHCGQRVRVPQAPRANRGRALAPPRPRVRDARDRAGRAGSSRVRPRAPHALDGRPGNRALPRELHRRDRGVPDTRRVLSPG